MYLPIGALLLRHGAASFREAAVWLAHVQSVLRRSLVRAISTDEKNMSSAAAATLYGSNLCG